LVNTNDFYLMHLGSALRGERRAYDHGTVSQTLWTSPASSFWPLWGKFSSTSHIPGHCKILHEGGWHFKTVAVSWHSYAGRQQRLTNFLAYSATTSINEGDLYVHCHPASAYLKLKLCPRAYLSIVWLIGSHTSPVTDLRWDGKSEVLLTPCLKGIRP
jgi:hypothetical protein